MGQREILTVHEFSVLSCLARTRSINIFLILCTFVCKFGRVEGAAQEKKLQTNE